MLPERNRGYYAEHPRLKELLKGDNNRYVAETTARNDIMELLLQ